MNPAPEPGPPRPLPRDTIRERIANAYHGRVQRFFLRKRFSPERADELTQDTFLRVSKAKEVPAELEDAKGWVFCIAHNVYKNELRTLHAAKREGMELDVDGDNEIEHQALEAEIAEARGTEDNDPLEQLLLTERRELYEQALEKLPPKMRSVLEIRVGRGLSYKEIASLLQIDVDTVKSHLSQAKIRLKELLRDQLGPPAIVGAKELP